MRIIFVDTEESNWAFDAVRRQFYWHRFFSHQPDLNFENPAVHEAIEGVLRFWLDLGVDAVRLDAIPYLYESEGGNGESEPATHEYVKQLRRLVDDEYRRKYGRYPDAIVRTVVGEHVHGLSVIVTPA